MEILQTLVSAILLSKSKWSIENDPSSFSLYNGILILQRRVCVPLRRQSFSLRFCFTRQCHSMKRDNLGQPRPLRLLSSVYLCRKRIMRQVKRFNSWPRLSAIPFYMRVGTPHYLHICDTHVKFSRKM